MKLLKFISIFSLVLIFSACSKDDKTLKGTWEISNTTNTGCTDVSLNESVNFTNGCVSESIGGFGYSLCITAVFTENTFTITQTTTIGTQVDTDVTTGSYTVNGNNVTLTDSSGDSITGTTNSARTELTITETDDIDNCTSTVRMRKK